MSEHDYDLYRRHIPPEIIGYISSDDAHGFGMVPVELGKQDFVVAISDEHSDVDWHVGMLRFMLKRPDVAVVRVSREALQFALARYYPR